ncbi:MAG: amino acid carrier protein [Clostridium sp.]|nr:amino acid carrier protein [Acetatifactor muris]MCM1526489.1 amino acid carrier protein [Bacteroides sp.]MCM1562385.1 amino acid carrier protein [Clostridium sp.]
MIAEWMAGLDELIWGPWLLVFMLGTGAWLMLRLRFLPVKRLKFALRCALGLEPEYMRDGRCKTDVKHGGSSGVSPFAALTTELAATIGTGNIVGVATAMVLGGPGALLWMMAASVLGLATKLVESSLSVKYRSYNRLGERVGGPMYTLRDALPRTRGRHGGAVARILAFLYALFAVAASFGMGNMTQSNSIAEACKVAFDVPVALTGLVLTLATITVVLGGIRSIASLTRFLVPFMGGFYVLGTLGVICFNMARIPQGIASIVVMAFAPQAVTGGLLGNLTVAASLSVSKSLRLGVSRGVFSNEAGLGAAGIAAAAADTEDYIRQGYISMTGVFLDTMVICLLTGLAFVSSGLLGAVNESGELLNGTELTIAVFSKVYGVWGARFVSVSIILFAFATIVAWAYQGEKAFEFLTGRSGYNLWYRFIYALTVFVGAICSLELVWNFSDICNGLMAVPNLIGVLILSLRPGGICDEILGYGRENAVNKK